MRQGCTWCPGSILGSSLARPSRLRRKSAAMRMSRQPENARLLLHTTRRSRTARLPVCCMLTRGPLCNRRRPRSPACSDGRPRCAERVRLPLASPPRRAPCSRCSCDTSMPAQPRVMAASGRGLHYASMSPRAHRRRGVREQRCREQRGAKRVAHEAQMAGSASRKARAEVEQAPPGTRHRSHRA